MTICKPCPSPYPNCRRLHWPQTSAIRNALHAAALFAEQDHCNVCHRSDLAGQENVPRLAHQREDYLLKKLREYKTGAPHGYDATMAEVLQPIDENDLDVLAYFLALHDEAC